MEGMEEISHPALAIWYISIHRHPLEPACTRCPELWNIKTLIYSRTVTRQMHQPDSPEMQKSFEKQRKKRDRQSKVKSLSQQPSSHRRFPARMNDTASADPTSPAATDPQK